MWFMSRPQERAQGLTPKGKLFMGVSSMWVGVVGVWLGCGWVWLGCGWVWLGCGFITIETLSYIRCIFKGHLLSEIKYSYCSHDAGLTDWSENQLCPQTLPVLMEPLNMDSLNKATSSEGACASLSEGSTSEPHNSAFGTQHPCREKHFQFLTLQREQPYTHQK